VTPFTFAWNYELTPSSSPFELGFGDPYIEGGSLILTKDDVVRISDSLIGGFVYTFPFTFVGFAGQAHFSTHNAGGTFDQNYPGLLLHIANDFLRACGTTYFGANAGDDPFGDWPVTVGDASTVDGEMTIYYKADTQQLAAKVKIGATEYKSGWVTMDLDSWLEGYNIGDIQFISCPASDEVGGPPPP
jgi:hypothetical protein